MDRRQFLLKSSLTLPTAGIVGAGILTGCGQATGSHLLDEQEPIDPPAKLFADMPMFAYYQGFGPNDTLENRDKSRTDGTDNGFMKADIANAGKPIRFKFWHGHGQDHIFEVTEEHFKQLQAGETVYILTTVVQGHKHCIRIDPKFAPENGEQNPA